MVFFVCYEQDLDCPCSKTPENVTLEITSITPLHFVQREGGLGINNMVMRARKINAKIDLVPIAGIAILTIHLP